MAARNKPAGSTKEERDRISLGRIEAFIDGLTTKHLSCPTCKKDMDANDLREIPSSVATLMRARYDKLRPTLAATEITVHDQRDTADPNELAQRLAAMFEQKPELLEQVLAIKAAASTQQQAQSESTQAVKH